MFKKKINPVVEPVKEEKAPALAKPFLYIAIVNKGQEESILKIYRSGGSAMQFIELAKGTASNQVLEILGITDNAKAVVIGFVKEEEIQNIKMEIDAYFSSAKRNKGIAFTIPLSSLVGMNVYQFLMGEVK